MYFKESTHEYTNGDTAEKYVSVTTYLSSLSKKKDWSGIAKGYLDKHLSRGTLLADLAKKWGISLEQAEIKWGGDEHTVDWLLGVWKENSGRSSEGGSTFHLLREQEGAQMCDTVYNPVVNDKKEFLDLSLLEDNTVYLELGLGSHLYKVWGQADRVFIEEDRNISIRDWKTNKRRDDLIPEGIAYYNKALGKKVIEYMLAPVSHLVDNKYWKYALQLSMYGYFLELHNYEVKDLYIDYVHTKYIPAHKFNAAKHEILSEEIDLNRIRIVDDSVYKDGIEPIKVPYLRREVIDILRFRQATLN